MKKFYGNPEPSLREIANFSSEGATTIPRGSTLKRVEAPDILCFFLESIMKICTKCGETKELSEFYKSGDYYRSECKECNKKKLKYWRSKNKDKVHEQYLRYYDKHHDDIQQRNRTWMMNNREQFRQYCKTWYQNNRDAILSKQKEYQRTHKIERKQYWESYLPRRRELFKEMYYNDPKFRCNFCFSNRMRQSLKYGKSGHHWEDVVDFNLQELMVYLESKFQPGMTWENYGEWHIDHVRPISSFSFESFEDVEFKQCWCLDNLQPLWAIDNLQKGAKY